MNGRVVHFELPVDDPERAKTFYADAFGWHLTDLPSMAYTMVTTAPSDDRGTPADPGVINGGMAPRGGPISAPVVTIEVDDVDEALDRVVKSGGRIVAGREAVGEMGYTAYFVDSEGSVVGLWQSAS